MGSRKKLQAVAGRCYSTIKICRINFFSSLDDLVDGQDCLRDVPDDVLTRPAGGEDGEVEEDGVEDDGQQQQGGEQAEARPGRHQVRRHHRNHGAWSANLPHEERVF